MYGNYLAMALIIAISVFVLLCFIKKDQIRKAALAFFVAQLFSWPITLLYVQFGLQENPVRFFPHATASNFLFAFIFHPSVFAVYYLNYPHQARKLRRLLFTALLTAAPMSVQFLAALFTDIIHVPVKLIFIFSYAFIYFLYTISRLYLDWYFRTYFPRKV